MFKWIVGVLLAALGVTVWMVWPAGLGDYAYGFTAGFLAAVILIAALSVFAFSTLAWGGTRE